MEFEDKCLIQQFVQNSSIHLKSLSKDVIEDMCARLKAIHYPSGAVLKQQGEELAKFYFVCKGSLGLYDTKYNEKGQRLGPTMINSFETGQSVGDPLLNCNVLLSSELRVRQNDALLVYLTMQDYRHVFREQIESIKQERQQMLFKNFRFFKERDWDRVKMKLFVLFIKQRVLAPNEILFEDGMQADYIHFLISG